MACSEVPRTGAGAGRKGDEALKRSEINTIMREGDAFARANHFYLPRFAYWTPQDWRTRGEEVREISDMDMGWDITDWGSGDFTRCGLFLFTIRNGSHKNLATGTGKIYAEKLLIVDRDQITPMHFHWKKMEDIINRGGGTLAIELYNSSDEGNLARTPVTVSLDGVSQTLPAGATVTLEPGDSITIPQKMYHKFWGVGAKVLVGEVSVCNDDNVDNRFHEKVGRFPTIEEDEEPLYLLMKDYPRYYRYAKH
jgi:D-lyxose ketol-isomerase